MDRRDDGSQAFQEPVFVDAELLGVLPAGGPDRHGLRDDHGDTAGSDALVELQGSFSDDASEIGEGRLDRGHEHPVLEPERTDDELLRCLHPAPPCQETWSNMTNEVSREEIEIRCVEKRFRRYSNGESGGTSRMSAPPRR